MNFFKWINRKMSFNKCLGNSQRHVGFTIAEILIVLGIIGIIAEMTIPSLISDFQDKAAVVALKHEISILQQAISLAVLDEGNIENWYSGTDASVAVSAVNAILSKYLKTVQNCHEDVASACVPSGGYKKFNPSMPTADFNTAGYSKINLIDGSSLYFSVNLDGTTIMNIVFIVDVNGLQGPNRIAYDTFDFNIYSNQYASTYGYRSQVLIPAGNMGGPLSSGCNQSGSGMLGIGWSCTSWAYYIGNRDYIHCRSVLNWDTKIACD